MGYRVWIDRLEGNQLKGWAANMDAPAEVVNLQLLVNGVPESVFKAGIFRSDLERKGLSDGYSGFSVTIPARWLNGEETYFEVRVANNEPFTEGCHTHTTVTPLLPFNEQRKKTWFVNHETLESRLIRQIHELDHENFDHDIGQIREALVKEPGLMIQNLGLLDKANTLWRVKTFEEIMTERHDIWFRKQACSLENCCKKTDAKCAIWQKDLALKKNMHRFAVDLGLMTPTVLASFDDLEQLLELDLPPRFVAKPDGYGASTGVFVISHGYNLLTGMKATVHDIHDEWLKLKQQNPRCSFIVEEFIEDEFSTSEIEHDYIPLDYKVYVFGGIPVLVLVVDRNYPYYGLAQYSVDWHKLNLPIEKNYPLLNGVKKPKNLEAIIEAARCVGEKLGTFCRIDFFSSQAGPVFGEITLLPANGKNFTEFGNTLLMQSAILFEHSSFWKK
ncbi:ATP-grasp fold amidoligase family protein [Halomonas sp. HNIBRBA4712]|uniref:ATP-grasp fold amidoligase family protein n=1 Tax=Halomonas sp. HNIBRBA4712 TaxID=3373087 RepID=UPI003744E37F